MIIFNDSINKFYQCSMFLVFASGKKEKKNAEAVKFLGLQE